ncbi:MAG TPA: hypothetical protein VG324_05130, partial [Blastocatellia bacterium]|nr:hypothetical protein [Blastocatellia bacterium]
LTFFHIHLWRRKNRNQPPCSDETVQKWREQTRHIEATVAPDDGDRPLSPAHTFRGAKDGGIDFTLAVAP